MAGACLTRLYNWSIISKSHHLSVQGESGGEFKYPAVNQDSQITILLVEDDEELLGLLESLLEEEGYRVLAAPSGEEALDIAQNQSYDLVVTDVKLGGIDGLDTLGELKRSRSELQSLVITGYATEADSIRAISLGVGNYLKKPFNLPDFLRAVQEIATQIYRERDLAEFRQAAYDTALWSLENLAMSSGKEAFLTMAKSAERAAMAKGLSHEASRHIRLSLLALIEKEADINDKIPFLLRILPEQSRGLLAQMNAEKTTVSDDLNILRYAYAKLTGSGLTDIQDLSLEEIFSAPSTKVAPSSEKASPPSVGKYLALAKALEVSGDIDAASRILKNVSEDDQRVTPQAHLYRARVHWLRGEAASAQSCLNEALESSGDMLQKAKIELEGGVLLAEMRLTETAQRWLERAVETFQELHHPSERCRAILALQATSNKHQDFHPEELETLLQPHQLEALLISASWLFPFLLSVPESSTVTRTLVRLTRDAPHAISKCLRSADLSVPHKLKGLDLIEQVGIEGYDEILQEFMLASESALRNKAQLLLENQDSVRVAPILRLYSLGTMSTWLGERKVPDKGWTGSKPFYLLNYLAQQGGQFVSQEKLLDLFWDGAAKANKNLNQTLVVARNALRSPDWPDKIDYVERRGATIGLSSEHRIWHDGALVMESLVQGENFLRDGQRERASDCFHQALELDRGPYLEACYDDWALGFRDTLQAKLQNGLTALADIRQSQNRHADAAMILEHVLVKDPFYTAGLKALFEARLALGQALEVVKYFERIERQMRKELELEPSMELVKLYHMARLKL